MGIEVQGISSIGGVQSSPRVVYFTGLKNDESTALTTTAIAIGASVCFTETGGKRGRGIDVTKPETALLTMFAGIVVGLSSPAVGQIAVSGDGSGTTAGNLIPGNITIVSAAAAVQALTKSNMTKPSSAVVPLGVANNSWALQTVTPSIATGAANLAGLAQIVALALETVDTSGAAEPGTLKWVKLGGLVGGLET